jgi:hypothetical protein
VENRRGAAQAHNEGRGIQRGIQLFEDEEIGVGVGEWRRLRKAHITEVDVVDQHLRPAIIGCERPEGVLEGGM